ncbi:flavin monoamine oxidase family protein [Psychrobacter phenylpyruvicus]|uniref:Putrescine oxidase n=1 Tax=Psychrobacter phenylpyruvicus TaxID=29432 RepID=A0A379LM02_9GAMM|nr:FAD-dependent oxidoreductase [Psychrobacter phenylpyruvicus]SUD90804.1 Putrescine oxidase [Psychrobacter phenylpyruvicus]
MNKARIAIIGAGLSGLYAAYLLQKQGIDYVLLEARDRIGGRIHSVATDGQSVIDRKDISDRFDLGPSWFWPGYQPQLGQLVQELGLKSFAQFEDGDILIERSPNTAPMRMQGYVSSPTSMRLIGGMAALTEALYQRLDSNRVLMGHKVCQLRKTAMAIEVKVESNATSSNQNDNKKTTWQVSQLLLALPPRLVEQNLEFTPALPDDLARQWRSTATWMAPHAKYFAIYDTPFWREQGLSGSANSAVGPLTEIHDASAANGHAALFGFFGITPEVRQSVSEDELKLYCREQLTRLFGAQAQSPVADFIKDWSQDTFTATTIDAQSGGQHPHPPAATATTGVWQDNLIGIGSEWSRQFPGYVAGAVEAASVAVHALLQ